MKKKTNQKPIYYRNYFKRHKYGEFDTCLGYVAVFYGLNALLSIPPLRLYGIFVRTFGDPINCNAMVDGRKREKIVKKMFY